MGLVPGRGVPVALRAGETAPQGTSACIGSLGGG